MDIAPVGQSASESSATKAGTTLAENFDSFLTLLTTQLQNQDPLEPLNSNEFTAQLVGFSGVEQAIATNKNLEDLIALQLSTQAAGIVSYLGKEIEAEGTTALLADGSATWNYSLPDGVATSSILVTDESGRAVYATQGETGAGDKSFVWDGRDNQGVPLPDGRYVLTVTARDEAGNVLPVTTTINGVVDGVEAADDVQYLTIGDLRVPLSSVLKVRTPPAG